MSELKLVYKSIIIIYNRHQSRHAGTESSSELISDDLMTAFDFYDGKEKKVNNFNRWKIENRVA